jgi:hypothetical protein
MLERQGSKEFQDKRTLLSILEDEEKVVEANNASRETRQESKGELGGRRRIMECITSYTLHLLSNNILNSFTVHLP